MKKKIEILTIVVPTILVLSILVYFFYIYTDMGYSNFVPGLAPISFPLWFESIVITLVVPFMTGFIIFDKHYPDWNC